MIGAFIKAELWRSRAEELRELAGSTQVEDVRAGLLAMADALDRHAHGLAKLALDLRVTAPAFRADATEMVVEAAD